MKRLTCTWNSVTESSSICTRIANFFPLRLAVDAVPSTPDGVLSECVIRPVAGAGPIESSDIVEFSVSFYPDSK